MIGMASEVWGCPETTPVVILQLTWSAGDYMVARKEIKSLNDLKRDCKRSRLQSSKRNRTLV